MSFFESCFPKRKDTRVYLPLEDGENEYEASNNKSFRNCFTCCFWRGQRKDGPIRLPEGATARRTIDDYLNPRSPVSIEVLLAEQEEELDHYIGQQTDDDDASPPNRRKSGMSYSFMDEEDAQFLSEHRISAILVERPKLSSALVFNQESNIVDTTASDDEGIPPQELLDLPAPSTSTSHTNDRVFPITALPKEDGHREKNDNILRLFPSKKRFCTTGLNLS
ncbi:unnamed protein product [Mucor hiemalis]